MPRSVNGSLCKVMLAGNSSSAKNLSVPVSMYSAAPVLYVCVTTPVHLTMPVEGSSVFRGLGQFPGD